MRLEGLLNAAAKVEETREDKRKDRPDPWAKYRAFLETRPGPIYPLSQQAMTWGISADQ